MNKRKLWKIIFVFLIPLILAGYMQGQEGNLLEGIYIRRNQAGQGEKELNLELNADGILEDYDYKVTVEEILFTQEEANRRIDEAILEIEGDFEEWKDRLPMKKTYVSGIVEASWNLSPKDCVDYEGNILTENIPAEGLLVNAKVGLTCQNYEQTYSFAFRIPPPEIPESTLLLKEIETYIEGELGKEGEDQLKLPSKIKDISLHWKEPKDNIVLKVFLLETLVAVLLYMVKLEKKKEMEKEYKESMESDYPKILGQMVLLLGAGMTISQAWEKLVVQYNEKRQQNMVEERPAFEEMAYILRRMREGESEREALTLMEKRVLLMSYRRFIHILLTNKSKGGDYLCKELEQEAIKAYNQRIYDIKQKGEEASTKMLLPLMLMLVMVIAIVIMPACIQFAG